MPHVALTQVFDDDLIETVDAIAAPLRAVSPHVADMTHAQELSDVTILCECLWAMLQGGPGTENGLASFRDYLERRRKVGFSSEELHAILATVGRVVGRRLDAVRASANTAPATLDDARAELAAALARLDQVADEHAGVIPA